MSNLQNQAYEKNEVYWSVEENKKMKGKDGLFVICLAVISALDELKKYDTGAREATKFLEQEFKKGNR